jgi:hypothetical protein
MTPRKGVVLVAVTTTLFLVALLGWGALFHESAHTYEYFEKGES